MRIRKCLAVLMMLAVMVAVLPATVVYAEKSDVDFTIGVDTDKQYIATNIIEVPIAIKTQTDNGYVELSMLLKFNQDALTCNTVFQDVDGFTTQVTDDGLQIDYISPNGEKSPIDTYLLKLQFTVKTGVASGKYKLELVVNKDDVFGYDKNGNKEKGLLTVSAANPKELTIIETGDDVTTAAGDGGDANFYIGTTTAAQPVQKSGGCVSAGAVFAFIIGAILVFAAGVVVGFILCQKRMNEEGYFMGENGGGSAIGLGRLGRSGKVDNSGNARTSDDFDDFEPRGGSIYDDLGDDYSARRAESSRQRASRTEIDEEDRVDTSYFGKAATQRIGDPVGTGYSDGYDDDDEDDDDGFPAALRPRRSRSGSEGGNRFSSEFDTVVRPRRRERDDDGYGSFTIDNEDETGDDFHSDRRRYH